MGRWGPLIVLAAAQFLMVLDQAVMNVSISQLVEDFDSSVTTIQAVITFYTLVMAALMLVGGKLGDLLGRRRIFVAGHVIYALGSALTAVSWSIPALLVGWSLLEGIGAALVLPALVALTASSYQGRDRALAFGVLGGVAGAGIAIGPLLGGWVTANLTWRLVFVGEVGVAAAVIIAAPMLIPAPAKAAKTPRLDGVGAALSAAGLCLIVFGVLQATSWGWLTPRNPPFEVVGFSPTPFVVAGGIVLLWIFGNWQRRRESRGEDPLVHMHLFAQAPLRAGLTTAASQNLILMGVFFAIPLYLQIVQGLDAFETGVRMLPVSVTLFITAMAGSLLASRWSPRTIVRAGFVVMLVACLALLGTVDAELNNLTFGMAMGVLGIGMGLIASQIGNIVQSSVAENDRSEAGGLQFTAQQLGSSLGTALVGAVVISGLLTAFLTNVENDPRIAAPVRDQVSIVLEGDVSFVASDLVRDGAREAGVDEPTVNALVEGYEESQLTALKTGLLIAALLSLLSLIFTRHLPARRTGEAVPAPRQG